MTPHSEHTSQNTSGSLTCLSTNIYKWKRLRSLTIYQILPRAQDRSWGIKLNVEVHAELLARPKSLCKKHKIGKREYKCTQQDLHQNYLHMHRYQQRGWWSLTAASQLWLGGYPKLRLQCNSFEVAHTSPHIHHINTPLWNRSRLPTRTPAIELTLILCVLEYPLSLVYELYRQPRNPLPRRRLFE